MDLATQAPTGRDAWRMAYHPGSTERVFDGLRYLADNIHRVPAFVIPAIEGRTDHAPVTVQAGAWGSILPARRVPREHVLHWDRWE